jgi:hypothetical protein
MAAAAASSSAAEGGSKPKIVFQEIPKYPTRDGLDMMAKEGPGALDPNRPKPQPVPEEVMKAYHDWDRHKAIPPKYLEAHWRDYVGRYIPDAPRLSIMERLFGSQQTLQDKSGAGKDVAIPRGEEGMWQLKDKGKFAHPCHAVNQRVRDCLDRNADKAELAPDYCRGVINVFEGCLREYRI